LLAVWVAGGGAAEPAELVLGSCSLASETPGQIDSNCTLVSSASSAILARLDALEQKNLALETEVASLRTMLHASVALPPSPPSPPSPPFPPPPPPEPPLAPPTLIGCASDVYPNLNHDPWATPRQACEANYPGQSIRRISEYELTINDRAQCHNIGRGTRYLSIDESPRDAGAQDWSGGCPLGGQSPNTVYGGTYSWYLCCWG